MENLSRFVGIWIVFAIYIAVSVEGVAYDGTCTGSGVGNCADTNNICDATSHKCACSSTSYLKDGTTECADKIALAGTCTASPTGQCADSNAKCHATDLICVCMSNYFANKNAACASRKNPNATCGGDECVTHASCVSSKCKCDAGYTPSPTTSPTMCSSVIKFAALPYMYVIPIHVSMMFILDHFKVFVFCDI
ncbi:unnamed protein product [Mytilus coruscus]|uniref:EB domain-containing protein n=1 Tax=Mytilus coruscus TaxID=42192 RepID=A0A6J8CH87_MYTCO|nr:unnamed protein product [Mytilus coruscus]